MKSNVIFSIGAALLTGTNMAAASISDAEAAQMLSLLNILRQQKGLSPLQLEQRLNDLAEEHSVDMSTKCNMVHEGSDGTSPGQRVDRKGIEWSLAGENIAAGQNDVRTVMDDWIASAPHLENLLNPKYNFVGFGKSLNSACDNFDVYWTQDFAAISSGAIPDPAGVQAPSPIGRTKSSAPRTKTTITTTTTTTKEATLAATTTTKRVGNDFRKASTMSKKSRTKEAETETPTPVAGESTDPKFTPAPRYKCTNKGTRTAADGYGGGQENSNTQLGAESQQLTAAANAKFVVSQVAMVLCILIPLFL
ncbi:CAP domain-containing protein [Cladochytrium replicatum]|nr:CAP domain-containing protein [Cladochytrium replicatum]